MTEFETLCSLFSETVQKKHFGGKIPQSRQNVKSLTMSYDMNMYSQRCQRQSQHVAKT